MLSNALNRIPHILFKKTCIGALPERGYFSQGDVNGEHFKRVEKRVICDAVEVRPVRKKKEFDVTKREGFADFIWNTDWQSHVDVRSRMR